MTNPVTNWLEVTVEADPESAEELTGVLRRYCPDGVVAVQSLEASDSDAGWDGSQPAGSVTLRGYLPVDAQVWQRRRQVEEAVWHVSQVAPGKLTGPSFREVREEDWANTWKQYYRPQRIGRRLMLGPTWEEFTSGPQDVVLRLDPGNAFGTGLHPTTRLALQLLETTPLAGKRLLDVGSGSGVLAIAAALFGANAVLALDTSPDAVRVTTENARVNGQEDRIAAREGSLEVVQAGTIPPFDVVVANIVAKVLTQLARDLARAVAPGGHLLLSGIIEPAELELMVTFATLGFVPIERLSEGDWRALRLRRES
ncbi:MAG TPA: 50S ribosomal protein L11 methyltransferase [Chloroflexota bacterium]